MGDSSNPPAPNSSQSLAHFLENKNFPAAKKQAKRRRNTEDPETDPDSLIVVDGKIVMNDAERGTYIEDRVTSFSYGKAPSKRSRWSKEETLLFYKTLSLCGTDFTMIEKIFTDRDRKQLKNKFSKEEKEHPERVNSALESKHRFSKSDLEKLKEEYSDIKNRTQIE
ncbi:hypothetical protein NEDG_01384 [Nematocida displodere]|uniref:Myb-like domain-containing protein n=1 Tax=Nematocida displodere TaxID=1805483 RepID=A0A177ECR0_9MICR|nr:hypothetical protein NEDG_01384 [Nematocida displodere]